MTIVKDVEVIIMIKAPTAVALETSTILPREFYKTVIKLNFHGISLAVQQCYIVFQLIELETSTIITYYL